MDSNEWAYNHSPFLPQAPSLLITLINMFLEFSMSPRVNASLPVEDPYNEFSVFGPSSGLANGQVGTVGLCISSPIIQTS